MLRSLPDLHAAARRLARPARIALCRPADAHSLTAALIAVEEGWGHVLLVGDTHLPTLDDTLRRFSPTQRARVEHVPAGNVEEACRSSVALVREGRADLLMKGLVNTDDLLHAVLDKELGLRRPDSVLTHVAVFAPARLGRLLILTDAAILPHPNLDQRRAQITAAVGVARSLGLDRPRIALLHFTEKVSERYPLTLDYRSLIAEAKTGTWGTVVMDGPMDFCCAVSAEALVAKGLHSTLEGVADILVLPDLEAGNLLYKTLQFFGDGHSAGLLCGAQCPIVLTSRGDSIETKILSLAVAALAQSK